jgi:hypothetical protein
MPSPSRSAQARSRLDVSPESRTQWLERRVAALERQLEYRIQVAADATDAAAARAAQAGDAAEAFAKAREFDALMQTRTMRLLRRPRAVYAWLLRIRRARNA